MRLVFDADEWDKTGDIGDNSQFWKPATILQTDAEGVCTVQFEDGRISKGHFYNATKPLPTSNVFDKKEEE